MFSHHFSNAFHLAPAIALFTLLFLSLKYSLLLKQTTQEQNKVKNYQPDFNLTENSLINELPFVDNLFLLEKIFYIIFDYVMKMIRKNHFQQLKWKHWSILRWSLPQELFFPMIISHCIPIDSLMIILTISHF